MLLDIYMHPVTAVLLRQRTLFNLNMGGTPSKRTLVGVAVYDKSQSVTHRRNPVRAILWGILLISAGLLLARLLSYAAAGQSMPNMSHKPSPTEKGGQMGLVGKIPMQNGQGFVGTQAEIIIEVPFQSRSQGELKDVYDDEVSIDQCFTQKPLMPWIPRMKFPETYLVFYRKPSIIGVLGEMAKSRGWESKLILTHRGMVRELQDLISPERFLVVITGRTGYDHMLLRDLANSTNALVAYIENAQAVVGSKEAQLTSFRNVFRSFGCSLEDSAIMPQSFNLNKQEECLDFFRYANGRPNSVWLHKPSGGVGGDGITIHSNLTFFYNKYTASCANRFNFIAQEYITNLLLLKKRKFDIRTYILLAKTSPHYLVFYHEGYLRVTMKEFDINGSRDVHLTNSHVQINVEGFVKDEHLWRFGDLQNYLDVHHPQEGRNFVSHTLIPFIKKIGVLIAQAGKQLFSRGPSNYMFLGLDFMVTSDLSVKFIEINHSPLWIRGTEFIDRMIPHMANDMFDLLLDCRRYPERFQYMPPGEMYGTWTLVWNENYAQCSNSPPYNPCKEFIP